MRDILYSFFQHQYDYLFFVSGSAFFLFGFLALRMHDKAQYRLCWAPLAVFGFGQGLHYFYHLLNLGFGDFSAMDFVCTLLVSISYLSLVEFAALNSSAGFPWLRRGLYFILAVAASLGISFGFKEVEVAVFYVFGFFGCALSSVTFFKARRQLLAPALAMACYALNTVFLITKAPFAPASFINREAFFRLTGVPAQFISGLCAIVLAVSAFRYLCLERWRSLGVRGRGGLFPQEWLMVVAVVAVFAGGWVTTNITGLVKDKQERRNIIARAETAAAGLDAKVYGALSATAEDAHNPGYLALRAVLMKMEKAALGTRWLYTMNLRGNEVIFVVDSIPADAYGHAEPGVPYLQPPQELLDVFRTGESACVGPYTDEWGSYISAFVPIVDTEKDAIVGVLGLDVEARDWSKMIFGIRFWPIAVTALIVVLLLIFFAHAEWQRYGALKSAMRFRYNETLLQFAKIDPVDLSTVMEVVTRTVAETLDAERVSIWRYTQQQGVLVCDKLYRRSKGAYEQGLSVTEAAYPFYFGALGKDRVIAADNAREDQRTRALTDTYLAPNNIYSLLDTPLCSHGKITGILSVEDVREGRRWREDEIAFAISAADILSSLFAGYERKEAEEKMRAAYEQLKETQLQLVQSAKMASVGLLAGGVAHEINNPLTGVLNNIQLIKMEAETKSDFKLSDFKELLDVVEESALRCKKITRSLLDFSHASKGEFHPLSVNEIIEKVVGLINHEFALQNINIVLQLQDNLPQLLGDSQLLQQVIFGMLVNAKWAIGQKEGLKDGEIRIKTEYEKERNYNIISISDNGIGIPKENMAKLFEPFFTTKDVGEGTGLGLALFYSIVRNHGGSIKVESQPGEGTTFSIHLPAI